MHEARAVAQVTHHENSRLHWSELPRRFLDTLPAHDRTCGAPHAALVVYALCAVHEQARDA